MLYKAKAFKFDETKNVFNLVAALLKNQKIHFIYKEDKHD